MPVQRIGTDENDTISVQRNELAGGTFDGAGGADVLVLSGATDHEIFDLTTAALVTGFETIRGGSTYTETIRLSATQLGVITTFESTGTTWADLIEIKGSTIDFRNKSFIGYHFIKLIDPNAHITVNSIETALKVESVVRGQHLTIEGIVPTVNQLTSIHNSGIDYVHYIENGEAKTSTDFAPTMTGLAGDRVSVVAGQAVLLDLGSNVEISDERPLKSMNVSLDDWIPSGDTISLDTSGIVTLAPDSFSGEDVFVDNVEIGTLQRSEDFNRLSFYFNQNATAERVAALIKAITYEHDGPTLPAGQNEVVIRITDLGHRSTEATVILQYPNAAPTDISLSESAVYENAFNGTFIGRLSSIDPNPGDTATYTLIDDAGGRFELDTLGFIRVKNGSLLDYETAQTHTIKVRVTDGGGMTFDKSLVITVADAPFDNRPYVPPVVSPPDAPLVVEHRNIVGTGGNDTLEGEAGNDTIFGEAGGDMLDGKAGNDTLHGGVGNDLLFGGTGKDIFVFDTKPAKKTNADWIRDYNVAEDTIWLDNKVFTKLGKKGSEASPAKLNKKYFSLKGHRDKDDYLAYNRKTGDLTYDADGSGKKFKPVLIAGIDGDGKAVSALSAAEFYVI